MIDHDEREPAVANVSRRAFLAGVAAGSLVLAIGLPSSADAQETKFGADGMPNGWRDDPKIFVSIGQAAEIPGMTFYPRITQAVVRIGNTFRF